MLNIQRRHSAKCPDRDRGPNYLKCRGRCRFTAVGSIDGKRVRASLKTRDLQRAARKLADLIGADLKPKKKIDDAARAFLAQHSGKAFETQRKYKRILGCLSEYADAANVVHIEDITLELLDGYAKARQKENWTWIKEVEILRQFLKFCVDRDWARKNPATQLRRPKLLEANDVVPYTREEVVRIIAACDQIGNGSYERLRARAMVLLMRFAGLRVSDVVTLSRDDISGNRLLKRAVKNGKWIRVELPREVVEALERLPRPKAAPQECRLYFASGKATLRSLVKGAERSLAVVFERAQVAGAHCHRFGHTLASEILGKGWTCEDAANILADSPATIRRHYAKWTAEGQQRVDQILRSVHATDLAQAEERISKC
jgi:site-specific recombinase XerD